MLEFNELKADILQRAREKEACTEQYKRAYGAETKEELLQVIADNIVWCYQKKMLDTPYMIENFGDIMEQFGIYVTGHHEVVNKNVILFGSSSATVETFDSSSAIYELKGDYSTIKDLTKRKLLVKKSKFEIVEID